MESADILLDPYFIASDFHIHTFPIIITWAQYLLHANLVNEMRKHIAIMHLMNYSYIFINFSVISSHEGRYISYT